MLDNLIITLFKTKWQYYFPDVPRIQPGGEGGGGGGGGGGLGVSAIIWTKWDLKISQAPVLT